VIAAGGDGTMALLANRLPVATPFTLFPMGTENLLAKYFGIAADIRQSCEIIAHHREIQLDAGEANGTIFLVMASCGLDADVVQRLSARRTGHIRHLSYVRPLWEAVFGYRYPSLRIRVDDQAWSHCPKWAFVFNVPRYAMNLPIVPEANPFDGRLDLRTFRHGSLWSGLNYLIKILLGRLRRSSEINYTTAERIEIASRDGQTVAYQLDGDPGGELPVTIRVLPQRVKLLVPPSFTGDNRPATELR
jgi:diacylglycerol kinase family enzyme